MVVGKEKNQTKIRKNNSFLKIETLMPEVPNQGNDYVVI